jgi:hypothetical protein
MVGARSVQQSTAEAAMRTKKRGKREAAQQAARDRRDRAERLHSLVADVRMLAHWTGAKGPNWDAVVAAI